MAVNFLAAASSLVKGGASALGLDAEAAERCLATGDCEELVDDIVDNLLELGEDLVGDLAIYAIEFGSEKVAEALIEAGLPEELASIVGELVDDVATDAAGGALEALGASNAAAALSAGHSKSESAGDMPERSSCSLWHDYGPGTADWKPSQQVTYDGESMQLAYFIDEELNHDWWDYANPGEIYLVHECEGIEGDVELTPNPTAALFAPIYQTAIGTMLALEDLKTVLVTYARAVSKSNVAADVPELNRTQLDVIQALLDGLADIVGGLFDGFGQATWQKTSRIGGQIGDRWFQPVVMLPAWGNYTRVGWLSEFAGESTYKACVAYLQKIRDETPAGGTDSVWDLFNWVSAKANNPMEANPERWNVGRSVPGLQLLAAKSAAVASIIAADIASGPGYDVAASMANQAAWEAERSAAIEAAVKANAAAGGPVVLGPIGTTAFAITPTDVEGPTGERVQRAKRVAQEEVAGRTATQVRKSLKRAASRVKQGEPPPRPSESSTAAVVPTTQESAPAGTVAPAVPIAAGAGVLFLLARLLA